MARFWSWQSCEWSILKAGEAAKIHTHITAVSYSDKLESALVRGAGRDILGTTDPAYVPGDMSIEMLSKWYREFTKEVTVNGEILLGELDFRMVIKRKSRTETDALIDELDFQVLGADDSATAGDAEPLKTTVPCLLTRVVRNGVRL